mgnify:CR=1 FL=1
MVMMFFWEVWLERFVGELCGGCCGSFGENDINVTKSDVLGLMARDCVGGPAARDLTFRAHSLGSSLAEEEERSGSTACVGFGKV